MWRPSKVSLHRHIYTTATVVLAATAAHVVVDWAGGLPSGPADLAAVLGVVLGTACFPADGADLDQVLRAADVCLYAAKRAGRNLVRVAGVAEIPAPRAAGDVLGVSVEL